MNNSNLTTQFKKTKTLIKNGKIYAMDEAELTEKVILPIIMCLDWDKNSNIIEQKYCSAGFMDVVLVYNDRYKVILESKRADIDLEAHKNQLYKYLAVKKNAKLGVLTNGHKWEFYLARYYYNWRMKKFFEIDIGNSSLKELKHNFMELLYINSILKPGWSQKARKNVNKTIQDNSIIGISDSDVIEKINKLRSKYQILKPQDRLYLILLEIDPVRET